MAIVTPREDPYQLEMKVGDASSFFEKTRLWKERLLTLVVKACRTVRSARAGEEHHPGDLLYAALVHSIVQIVEIVLRQNKALPPDAKIDLQFPMRGTGAWKPDVSLKTVVDLAMEVLRVYRDEDFSRADLLLRILKDFEVIWMEVLDSMFDAESRLLSMFTGGGFLRKNLLGDRLYETMTGIRTGMKIDRGQQAGQYRGVSGDIAIAMGS